MEAQSSALPPQPPPKESFARRYKFEVSHAYAFGCQPCCWRLVNLLEDITDGSQILIFMTTKEGCDQVTQQLCMDGWQALSINGDKSQAERVGSSQSLKLAGVLL